MWEFFAYAIIGYLVYKYVIPKFKKKFVKRLQICNVCNNRYDKGISECPKCVGNSSE